MSKYRTFGARIAAFLLDSFIYIPMAFVSYLLFRARMPVLFTHFGTLLILLAPTFYRIMMHVSRGQTFGKMAANIKIVTDSEYPITINHAVLRSSPQIFFVFSLLLVAAPYRSNDAVYDAMGQLWLVFYACWIFLDNICALISVKRKSLHDWLSGTVVVKI